jgi:hypothetical protein
VITITLHRSIVRPAVVFGLVLSLIGVSLGFVKPEKAEAGEWSWGNYTLNRWETAEMANWDLNTHSPLATNYATSVGLDALLLIASRLVGVLTVGSQAAYIFLFENWKWRAGQAIERGGCLQILWLFGTGRTVRCP